MPAKAKSVKEYLGDLEKNKSEKPDHVKEGLEMYVDLWKKAISNGVVSEDDGLDAALVKIEGRGGLYQAAEG